MQVGRTQHIVQITFVLPATSRRVARPRRTAAVHQSSFFFVGYVSVTSSGVTVGRLHCKWDTPGDPPVTCPYYARTDGGGADESSKTFASVATGSLNCAIVGGVGTRYCWYPTTVQFGPNVNALYNTQDPYGQDVPWYMLYKNDGGYSTCKEGPPEPTIAPTSEPTEVPTPNPTAQPTVEPTAEPTRDLPANIISYPDPNSGNALCRHSLDPECVPDVVAWPFLQSPQTQWVVQGGFTVRTWPRILRNESQSVMVTCGAYVEHHLSGDGCSLASTAYLGTECVDGEYDGMHAAVPGHSTSSSSFTDGVNNNFVIVLDTSDLNSGTHRVCIDLDGPGGAAQFRDVGLSLSLP